MPLPHPSTNTKQQRLMKSKFLIKLLSLLGFSTVATSCELVNEIGGGGNMCAYGCPSADYVFNVDVKDADTDAPIRGMRVSVIQRHTRYNPSTQSEQVVIDTLGVAETNAEGRAFVNLERVWPDSTHEVAADDLDGDANGGHYSTVSTEVVTEKDDYENPGSWYSGKATHNVTLRTTKLGE